jgi:2-methylfumaryl-CoA isomerase
MQIVEMSSYVAAPLSGLTLAQLGADVIRVEPRGGQADRSRLPVSDSGTSLYWAGLNKGKRSVEVDFGTPEGRSVVRDLVARSGERGGILVSNTTRFADLSYEALRAARHDVIHVALGGYRDGTSAVDYTVQAEVGLHAITGPQDTHGPVNDVLPFWDVVCGLYLSVGLLTAVQHRMRTGEGQSVKIALRDVAMANGEPGIMSMAHSAVTSPPRTAAVLWSWRSPPVTGRHS